MTLQEIFETGGIIRPRKPRKPKRPSLKTIKPVKPRGSLTPKQAHQRAERMSGLHNQMKNLRSKMRDL